MHRRGFTLIELLIVVVIIGILAAIAIPKFSSVREKSYIAAVTSDLKHVASQQEVYHSSNQVYASDVSDLTALTITDGVSITINEADGTGWAATGVHAALTGRPCGIFYGTASAANASPATTAGVVICTP
ncbi:MAG: prepilin-type N-terminal cleavage/methylation domain-containing protein [Longimicrobiales bacterium]